MCTNRRATAPSLNVVVLFLLTWVGQCRTLGRCCSAAVVVISVEIFRSCWTDGFLSPSEASRRACLRSEHWPEVKRQ